MKNFQKVITGLILTAMLASAIGCGGGYGGSGSSVYHAPPTPAPTKSH